MKTRIKLISSHSPCKMRSQDRSAAWKATLGWSGSRFRFDMNAGLEIRRLQPHHPPQLPSSTLIHGWGPSSVSPYALRLRVTELKEPDAAGGFHPHLPGFKHKFLGTALGATMWFFMFYRMRFVAANSYKYSHLTIHPERTVHTRSLSVYLSAPTCQPF